MKNSRRTLFAGAVSGAALVSLVVLAGVGIAGARSPSAAQYNGTATHKVNLELDCEGLSDFLACDSSGPTGFGFVQYKVENDGTLRVHLVLKNATPATLHRVFYVCGPLHGPGQPICGAFELGTVTTSDRGNANVHFEVENAPFAGAPNDHIDVRGGGPGCPICGSPVYIATPVVR